MHHTTYQTRLCFLQTIALIGSAIALGESSVNVSAAEDSAQRLVAQPSITDQRRMKTFYVLDRLSMADADQATFHLNPARKHPASPVLTPGEPHEWDSLQVVWPGTVLYDAGDKLFRCWYSGLDALQKNRPKVPWVPGYAESRDGLHWTKPKLGQHTHSGEDTNRISVNWSQQVLTIVVKNPDQSDPQRKFLALWHVDNETGQRKIMASSPDGKAWKEEGISFEPEGGDRLKFIDVSSLIFQPDAADENDRLWIYGQMFWKRSWDDRVVRQIGRARGPNLGSFQLAGTTDEEFLVFGPEKGIDEEVHFASVRKFGDLFVMLFESDRFSQSPLHGDLRLAVSNDGLKFRRVHPETPLVATGARGMWDENLLVVTTAAMQEVGDEIWIYYFGCPNVFRGWPSGYAVNNEARGSLLYPGYLGLATLPRDRFAYAAGPGSVTTPTLSIGDQGLWLNVDGDGLIVTCVSSEGATVAQGQIAKATDKSLYRRVEWTSGPPPQRCQIKIDLADKHRIYSLRY